MNIHVLQIDTATLGDRSYVIHDGQDAIVIDPQRDIDRLESLIVQKGLTLSAVAETHLHNDYLSGGLELAHKFDVPYILNGDSEVAFERFAIRDLETFVVGSFAIRAINTPGHTYEHVSYLILDSSEQVIGVATGGSLLHGATGRPDLLGVEHAAELAGLQFDSAHRISDLVPADVSIYPTHGFGSFCSASPTTSDASSIRDQIRSNPVLLQEKSIYVEETLSKLDTYPTYFDLMSPANSKGPAPIRLNTPTQLSGPELEQQLALGTWVVDLRNRQSWTAHHLVGSTNLGMDGSMASYLGWLLPHSQNLVLISDEESDVVTAVREIARIGIETPIGSFIGDCSVFEKTSSIKSVKFSDFANNTAGEQVTILDVRQNLERQKSHIAESMHIPFYEVQSRINELPTNGEIWVHCASAYRAASVLGMIESSGRTVVLIDDNFEEAAMVSVFEIVETK